MILSIDQPLILIVGSYPYPNVIAFIQSGKNPICNSYASGPEMSNLLEVQRRVGGIGLQQFEVLPSSLLHRLRKTIEAIPKTGRSAMHLRVLQRFLGQVGFRLLEKKVQLSPLGIDLNFLIP